MTTTATRPLNWDAVDAADEAIYAAHEDDRPRPNALFDAEGNRKPIDPTKGQDDLIEEWFKYYEENGGEVENSDVPSDKPPDTPVEPCPDEDELWLVEIAEEHEYETIFGGRHEKKTAYVDPTKDRPQYVNRKRSTLTNVVPRADFSREINLRARVMWKSGKGSDLAGHTVKFKIEPLAGNREGLPAELAHGHQTGKEVTSQTELDGWTPPTTLALSIYGGDRFRIRVTLESGGTGELMSGIFTVWRLVNFNVETMDFADGTTRHQYLFDQGVHDVYESCFVKFDGPETDTHPSYQGIVSYSTSSYNEYITANSLVQPYPPSLSFVYADLTVIDPNKGEKFVKRKRLLPKDRDILLVLPIIRTGAVDSAEWRQRGGTWSPFPLEHVEIVPTNDPMINHVRFDTIPVHEIDLERRVWVKFTLRVYEELLGFSREGWNFMATRQFRRMVTLPELVVTTVHEAGHAFGIPATATPEGAANPHIDGVHCDFGDKGCVMYKLAGVVRDFCPTCSDSLRARDLSKLPLDSTDPYTGSA